MLPPITSLQNPRIKDAVKLRDRKGRMQQGRIIVDGLREIWRGLQAGLCEVELFVCLPLLEQETRAASDDASARQIVRWCQQESVPISPVSVEVMEKLAFGDRVEPVIATTAPPDTSLDRFVPRQVTGASGKPLPHLLAVLEGLEKPGNVGAILRTADAAGISGVIIANGGTDLFNPATIRASLGAAFTLPIAVSTSQQAVAWMRERKIQLLAARVDGAKNYTDVDLALSSAIILGSEAEGLTLDWVSRDIQAIRLPMLGIVDSLNVSVSAGVLFYEALRQRERGR